MRNFGEQQSLGGAGMGISIKQHVRCKDGLQNVTWNSVDSGLINLLDSSQVLVFDRCCSLLARQCQHPAGFSPL